MAKKYVMTPEQCAIKTGDAHCHCEDGPCCFCGADLVTARAKGAKPLPSTEPAPFELSPFDALVIASMLVTAVRTGMMLEESSLQNYAALKASEQLTQKMLRRLYNADQGKEAAQHVARLISKVTRHSKALSEDEMREVDAMAEQTGSLVKGKPTNPAVEAMMGTIFGKRSPGGLS